jgi:5-hydroxyisourate hydrolase
MSTISTHVLDAVLGKPAEGIAVHLEKHLEQGWTAIGEGHTDRDGRCRELGLDAAEGIYRISFALSTYFARHSRTSLYPEITISFHVDGSQHYHIPLLLSDNSYTTYRGS